MKIEINESVDRFVVRAALPGVDPQKIDLKLNETTLGISAEMENMENNARNGYISSRYSYGKVHRSLDFSKSPVNVQAAKADFKDGVLEITLPKKELRNPDLKQIPLNA